MKSRPNLLQRLLARLSSRPGRTKPAPKPAKRSPTAGGRPQPVGIEPLEGRVAPAALVGANAIYYTDLDGDLVTVTFSEPLFDVTKTTSENRLDQIFKFSNGTGASTFDATGPQQLQLIDITQVPVVGTGSTLVNPATGTDIIVEATAPTAAGGNGKTNVGGIEANGVKLGKVKIDGDLGQIDVGTGSKATAIKSLKVDTLGQFGATTQISTATAADALESRIVGQISKLSVQSDLYGYVNAVNGIFGQAPGGIGSVKVGGSLIGNVATGTTSDNTGSVQTTGTIGSVSVGGTASAGSPAGLLGGGGARSGSILAGAVESVSIAGSINGGAGLNSGAIILTDDLGSLSVAQGLAGGAGAGSASVQVTGKIADVDVTGLIRGGAGEGSAVISATKAIDSVTIAGSIMGGGTNSGGISAKNLPSVLIDGSLLGATTVSGTVFHTSFIEALANGGTIKVKGTLTGGDAANSAVISTGGTLAKVIVNGAMQGGAGANSGSIFTGTDFDRAGDLTSAKLKGGVTGGAGLSSGSLIAGGPIALATIGSASTPANLTGGAGVFSGIIWSDGAIASVVINGSLTGGMGNNSGAIHAGGVLASATIDGALTGGAGELSGAIVTHGDASDVLAVSIGSSITGGLGAGSGGLRIEGSLGALAVSGAMTDADVRAAHAIGTITVAGAMSGTRIAAAGPAIVAPASEPDAVAPSNLTIESIKIGGNVSSSQILAGYDLNGFAVNADAAIGTVKANSNWISSDVAAGVEDVEGDGFGDAGDAPISGDINDADLISKIGKIVVKGAVVGTSTVLDDHFGFTAERIVAVKIGGTTLALSNAVPGQVFELGLENDTTVREVLPA